jgi:hypothetical protein
MTQELIDKCSGGITMNTRDVVLTRTLRKDVLVQPCDGQPKYIPGRLYYIKETWQRYLPEDALFRTDGEILWSQWRASSCMPKDIARYVIQIDKLYVTRLHEISKYEALSLGLRYLSKDGGKVWKFGIPDEDGLPGTDNIGWPWNEWSTDHKVALKKLWDSTYKEKAPWSKNLWVWMYQYHLVKE